MLAIASGLNLVDEVPELEPARPVERWDYRPGSRRPLPQRSCAGKNDGWCSTELPRRLPVFPYMQMSLVPMLILLLLLLAGGVSLSYLARPKETPEQYAHRICKETPTAGVTYERCVEGRTLQRLAGRQDVER